MRVTWLFVRYGTYRGEVPYLQEVEKMITFISYKHRSIKMKKILPIILFAISVSSFGSSLIYCPDKVVCAKKGSLASCSLTGGDQNYWNHLASDGMVQNAIYTFQSASGTYMHSSKGDITQCKYQYQQQYGTDYILVTVSNPSVNLEAHVVPGITDWWYNGYSALCDLNAASAKTCPFDIYLSK